MKNLAQQCRDAGLNFYTVYNRINKFGWDMKKALSTPPRPRRKVGEGLSPSENQKVFRDKKRLWLHSLRDKPCKDCKRTFPIVCMDYDHVRGKKLFNISKSLGKPKEVILREIAKCEVVCSNCHRIRTQSRR